MGTAFVSMTFAVLNLMIAPLVVLVRGGDDAWFGIHGWVFSKIGFCIVAAALFLAVPTAGRCEEMPVRVQFRQGASSAQLEGKIVGYQIRDFLLSARAGQTMELRLSSRNRYAYLALYRPSADGDPVASDVSQWSGTVPESGVYRVRVYLMRAGARKKGAEAEFSLAVSIR